MAATVGIRLRLRLPLTYADDDDAEDDGDDDENDSGWILSSPPSLLSLRVQEPK